MEKSSTPPRSARQRNRASVACTSCRLSRTKCFTDAGQKVCDQCRRSGMECIIQDDDRRRRPVSKTYTASLLQRIESLEGKLRESNRNTLSNGVEFASQDRSQVSEQPISEAALSTEPKIKEAQMLSPWDNVGHTTEDCINIVAPPGHIAVRQLPTIAKHTQMANRLLSPFNMLHTNSSCGRIQYFGSTANMHIHFGDEISSRPATGGESGWRIEMLLPEISSEILNYLIALFWKFYNGTIHLVHKDAFHEDRVSGRWQYYSTFLHFCMLSIGFRYADKTRKDIQRIMLPNHESTLHRKALKMAEYELQRSGGLSSVQALFLLGDLECGCGRDDIGWMYGGMSIRLAFDIGLHLEQSHPDMKDRDVQIRHMVMWACIINDKYWSLFLGRPTMVKSDTIVAAKGSKTFNRLIAYRSTTVKKTLETKVYEALLVLMDIAGAITDILSTKDMAKDSEVYFQMAVLDKDLNAWYSGLPPDLKWTPKNVAVAPSSFFLLHQQYHTSFILLHRSFVDYRPSTSPSHPIHHSPALLEHVSQTSLLSRNICLHNAIAIATIFAEHQKRFDVCRVFVTGLQHAGTAATAIIAEKTTGQDVQKRKVYLEHLRCLSDVVAAMAKTYKPAERMSEIILLFITELGPGQESGILHPFPSEKSNRTSSLNPQLGYEAPIGGLDFTLPDYSTMAMDASSGMGMGMFENDGDFITFLDSVDQIGVGLDVNF